MASVTNPSAFTATVYARATARATPIKVRRHVERATNYVGYGPQNSRGFRALTASSWSKVVHATRADVSPIRPDSRIPGYERRCAIRTIAIGGLVAMLGTATAFAQPANRLYLGATTSTQHIGADNVAGAVGAAGGLVGFRLTRALGIEVETNLGFGELSRVQQGTFVSFAGPDASREEIERLGVTMRSETLWTPGLGFSLLAVWSPAQTGRVGAAVFGGITSQRYDARRTMRVLNIPPGVNHTEADLHRMMPDEQGSRTRGGLTGGVLVPIRFTRQLSVAPEIRYTYGSFGDETYTAFRAGARVMWGF